MRCKIEEKQTGFTILELMIATTVFSLVLMLALAGITQITKIYYHGVTLAHTQEVARGVIDEIGESIRFSKDIIVIPESPVPVGPIIDLGNPDIYPDTGYICVGTNRYTYAIDRQLKNTPTPNAKEKVRVLWVDQPTSCTGPAELSSEIPIAGRELLSENMRLARFSVKESQIKDTYTVDISVVYGDDDLLFPESDGTVTCKSSFVGADFCGFSNLSVSVFRRL